MLSNSKLYFSKTLKMNLKLKMSNYCVPSKQEPSYRKILKIRQRKLVRMPNSIKIYMKSYKMRSLIYRWKLLRDKKLYVNLKKTT
jgi:hypothetical protein